MPEDQYQKGLSVIRSFTEAALREHGIAAAIEIAESGPARQARLSISANGNTQSVEFSYDAIEDSGEAIDAPSAAKVRQLVSHFLQ